MAKTHEEILDDWINYMIASDKIESRESIPDKDMERLVVAAKKHERFSLLRELNQMPIKDEDNNE